MEAFTTLTVTGAFALALALVVERILEMGKSAYDMLDSRRNYNIHWTKRAERTRDLLQTRLNLFAHTNPSAMANLLSRANEMMLGPEHKYTGSVPVISADLIRCIWIRTAAKVVGTAIGLSMALTFGIDLIATASGQSATVRGMVLTGIAIGLGSGVVHKMISALDSKRARNRFVEESNA